jgi:hypothetical protein
MIIRLLISKTQAKLKDAVVDTEIIDDSAGNYSSPYYIYLVISTIEERIRLIDSGVQLWNSLYPSSNTPSENIDDSTKDKQPDISYNNV